LFIDTSPYNAHTTAIDSLKSGVPVITMLGESFPARVAASLLNAIGLAELITKSPEEYESLAIDLGKNPEKLAEVKARLTVNILTMPLFNTPLFAKNIEAAYTKMYERYQADLPPDHFFVS
jgi:predicted O-linked N-acetylglucosamine transferase (SPINDLY family)